MIRKIAIVGLAASLLGAMGAMPSATAHEDFRVIVLSVALIDFENEKVVHCDGLSDPLDLLAYAERCAHAQRFAEVRLPNTGPSTQSSLISWGDTTTNADGTITQTCGHHHTQDSGEYYGVACTIDYGGTKTNYEAWAYYCGTSCAVYDRTTGSIHQSLTGTNWQWHLNYKDGYYMGDGCKAISGTWGSGSGTVGSLQRDDSPNSCNTNGFKGTYGVGVRRAA